MDIIHKVNQFYNNHIAQLGQALQEYFGGILINLQLQFLKKHSIKYVYRGEIYLINLGYNIGSEYNKIRPGIIISGNEINKGNTVIIVPISSYKSDDKIFKYDIIINNNDSTGLTQSSVIKTSHIKNIDKKRLIKKIGILDNIHYSQIEQQLDNITKKSTPPKE